MALEIIWTKEAKDQLAEVIASLEAYGNEQLLHRFSQQLDKKLELIKEHPQIYQKSDRLNGVRRCLVDKYRGFFYSHDAVFVYIIAFWDGDKQPT